MTKAAPQYFILILLLALMGCPENVRPDNTTERIFVAQWTLIGATNAVADLKPYLSADDYANAKTAVLGAGVALSCAKMIANVPGAAQITDCPTIQTGQGVAGYLDLANKLLLQAASYYALKGE